MASIDAIIDLVHPTVSGVAVLLSDQIWILFDREIDETLLQQNLIVTGPDNDTWSGPDLQLYKEADELNSEEEILQSPGYYGIVQGTFSFERIDLVNPNLEVSTQDTIGSGILFRSKAIFTPTEALFPDTQYTVYLSGDEDNTDTLDTGISTRTVYDPIPDPGNSGTGDITLTGSYTGTINNTFYIEVTTAGIVGTARFKYYKATGPETALNLRTRRSGTLLSDGITVAFDEGTYQVGDKWSVVVKPRDTFTGNVVWSFLTGSGSIVTLPESVATTVIGDVVSSGTDTDGSTFEVESTSPADESSHQTIPDGEYTISVTFSNNINPATVASGVSVSVVTEPVDGDIETPASGLCISSPSVSGSTLNIVVASGALLNNNLVTITLDSGISSTSGVSLGSDYEFWFTTTYYPYYCTLRKIQLEIGSYLTNIPDDTINFSIRQASIEADARTWNIAASSSDDYYKFVRTQWTCCKAQETLLINVLRGEDKLKAKQLGDLRVEYYQASSKALDKALACLERLEGALNAGGAQVQVPQITVKGEYDPDRPAVGRAWSVTRNTDTPASNTYIKDTGYRRYHSVYSPAYKGKGRYGK